MIQSKEIKLEAKDWQTIVDTCKRQLKDALIQQNIWTNTLRMANSELKMAEAAVIYKTVIYKKDEETISTKAKGNTSPPN